MECNGKSNLHNPKVISDGDALRLICDICHHQYVIRKDWRGVPLNRTYSKIFKRDILQGSDNLLYKYFPQYLKT